MDIVQRIIDTRIDHDETQRQLAKAIGVHHVQWANYERRQNEIPTRYIIAFCQHYGVSADYILGLPRGLDWPR